MFNRKILDSLQAWADRPDRKPLILRGARQVGKTTAVRMFGSRFDQFLFFNLELRSDREPFEQNLRASDLVDALLFLRSARRRMGRTLLFIDEIQNSPQAVAMLRYLHEDAPDLHIIAAGSLLEVMMDARRVSFPVGRVEYSYLHPVTFEEFLQAIEATADLEAWRTVPLPEYAHSRLLERFHQYTRIGGMPEVVRLYSGNPDVAALDPVYSGLITSYVDDAGKYARSPAMFLSLRHAIETAPLEAGKRIKFQGFGRSNYRAREMGEALRTLQRAMLVHLMYPTTSTRLPVAPDLRRSPRLQLLDTGLLCHALGLQPQFHALRSLSDLYQGILAEHVVAQELIGLGFSSPPSLSFWVREKPDASAEVDFVVPHGELLIPVEVKSGREGTLRSLHQFMEAAPHPYAVRLWSGGIERTTPRTAAGRSYSLLSLPYHLAGRLPGYLGWLTGEGGR